jgi:hypothetical protein
MDRRVIIGKYNDGVHFGLRCTLPGFDALTGDSSQGGFSFDSEWTNMAQLLQSGLYVGPTYGGLDSSGNIIYIGSRTIPFANQGYIPYVEIRAYSGDTIYDDLVPWATDTTGKFGVGAIVTTTTIAPSLVNGQPGLNSGQQVLYVIYKVPVASG